MRGAVGYYALPSPVIYRGVEGRKRCGVNRRIGSTFPGVVRIELMLFNRPGEWVETQVRLLVVEGFELSDLREVVLVRDRMLGAAFDGPTERLPWGRIGSERDDVEFLRNLTEGKGFGSPLGDLLALAIRMTDTLRLERISPILRDAIDEWFESLCRWDQEEWIDSDDAIRVVMDYLRRQLGMDRG